MRLHDHPKVPYDGLYQENIDYLITPQSFANQRPGSDVLLIKELTSILPKFLNP